MTFLAVFLIQNSQNRDGAAMQAKLDEILRALDNAREEFVGIEHLTDDQIEAIREALENDIQNGGGKASTVTPTVERLLDRYRSAAASGHTAGPLSTSPSAPNCDPWHGQSQHSSSGFQWTMQPAWVQTADRRDTAPSARR